jgi:hypothetical protein
MYWSLVLHGIAIPTVPLWWPSPLMRASSHGPGRVQIQVYVMGSFARGFPNLVRAWQQQGFLIGCAGDTAWPDYSAHWAGDVCRLGVPE